MYLYYAIFSYEDGAYNVSFPDLDGAFTFGDTMSDALHMAKDLLEGWLVIAEDEGDEIPEPSEPKDINLEDGDLLIPIEANVAIARAKFENKLIKKTLTIPKYINMLAEEVGINFSATLTEVLKDKLGV
ncbi:type II toxin-antitoxin system HicB family antitoxin [Tuanshanicoccus lijuaniae]|uniref:type II toxin-antitoxin system HicB family antitoxin n=1 Tax=Aerococcaceae bacterium zg-1292 TaxID=2774330 RepID=UPI001937F54C|nr:type II toxin-antitoxin system HicB family antitoxin [Aerococcaceae bacterium zg-1292]QQA36956.1 type II toxin-antitoxin system HicB family antitoxin [Aerococcaceae bacterium zg-1292]